MSAEQELVKQGVFKGIEGLRGLATADQFWERQDYGTRLYWGPGVTAYLHRSVLEAAIKALDGIAALEAELIAERARRIKTEEALQDLMEAVRYAHALGHGIDPDIREMRNAAQALGAQYPRVDKESGHD